MKNSTEVKEDNLSKIVPQRFLLPLILIISLFFMWGMVNNLNDILISQFKKAFRLSDFHSGLVQSAFYLGYFFLALPASIIIRKYNYKTGIITGLLLFAAGAFLFYPAAQNASYGFFLLALFVIAGGLAFLETTANPFVTVLGSPQTATLRLNLAQAFNPVGCITGVLVGQHFIFSGVEHSPEVLAQMSPEAIELYYKMEIRAVETPYLCIGIVVLIFTFLFAMARFPRITEEKEDNDGKSSLINGLKKLAKAKQLKKAIVAQFFYLGAQVGIWSFLIRYIKQNIEGATDISAANYLTWSLMALALGRFAGTYLLKYIKPDKLLTVYAIIIIALVLVAVLSPTMAGVWALVASSFFMSIMYPTIFSFGVSGLGKETKLASSVLVMAIAGGAVLTTLMGRLSDRIGITNAYLVPAFCFVVVALFGISMNKNGKSQTTIKKTV
ncbi:MAG: L-fucose:H+ symporter permease [Candidatus Symbiothrix sp.]|jgi:FHS family L-fucose permease-like MFS transporter|nr:L-fucose:H+ symporter permease [Candidatus Symbiothrix sp.]